MAANEADRAKLHQICDLSYKAQAVWFLNGFWDSHQAEAEKFWAYVHKANAIDIERHESGAALDELNAHRLLEMFDETLTVREMRTQLRSVGAIGEKEHPKLVPLAHLLLARYKVDWHHFVNAPQGDQEEINRAQARLDACKAAFEESNARAAEAAEALRRAEAAAAAAAQREAASKAAAADLAAKEAELRAAQAELDAALAEVKAQEDAYNAKTAELRAKSETGGVVSMNRAKNELAQHLAEDPLPLRKAKITAEAAAKRNERALTAAAAARQSADAAAREAAAAASAATAARQAAEQAAAQATAARQEAERSRAASAEAKAAADAALARAEAALAEAEAFLEQVKLTAGGGKGALWWIERELHEQKKYLPTSRGGIAKH